MCGCFHYCFLSRPIHYNICICAGNRSFKATFIFFCIRDASLSVCMWVRTNENWNLFPFAQWISNWRRTNIKSNRTRNLFLFFITPEPTGTRSQLQACSSSNSTHYVHLIPAVNVFVTSRYPFSAGSTEAIRGRESCSRTQHGGTWRGSNARPCGHGADALPRSHHAPYLVHARTAMCAESDVIKNKFQCRTGIYCDMCFSVLLYRWNGWSSQQRICVVHVPLCYVQNRFTTLPLDYHMYVWYVVIIIRK
jgi:hypothetical protein